MVVPKLIHPLPPAINSPEASPEHRTEDTWMQVYNILSSINLVLDFFSRPSEPFIVPFMHQELNANRPPTPTRGRPQTSNDRGSLAWI